MKNRYLLVLLGPTGVGKSDLAIKLAKKFKTVILSADSRQLYEPLKIGTAAPTKAQLDEVKHYFVGTLKLTDYYSAAQFETEALALLEELFQENQVVILTGGSMMYIDAVCKGIDDIPTVDVATREQVMNRFKSEGLDSLCDELKALDPEYHLIVDLRNPKRVMHALEICIMTGKTYTSFRTQTAQQRPFQLIQIGLKRERAELYDRINQRVDQMMEEGLLEEVKKVSPFKAENALNTVGYKELFCYLEGDCELDFAIDKIKQHTRIYSRKQTTWFKKNQSIVWFHPDQEREIEIYINQQIR